MTQEQTAQEIQQQAGMLLGHVAGLVGTQTIAMGLEHGLIEAVATHPDGIGADALAAEAGVDPYYTGVWCRTAYGVRRFGTGDVGRWRHVHARATP
ncbi:MAG TPA: hypothetical protein QF624_01000 [Dehalococcoidia bacterium]|mgnify:CR=1 FL=1|nr:hypothetical protein [Dehalococcoidia bacterium]